MSDSHKITWKHVDTVTFFSKNFYQRSMTPLTPRLLRFDSTKGPLCPSPMGIYQCTWIQWCNITSTYIQNEWSYSHFRNKVPARQKRLVFYFKLKSDYFWITSCLKKHLETKPCKILIWGYFLWKKRQISQEYFENLWSLMCTHCKHMCFPPPHTHILDTGYS